MSDDNKNGTAPKRPPLSSFAKGFAGSLGGVAEAVCLQPMDVIKTRLQLDNQGKYKGIAHCGNVGTHPAWAQHPCMSRANCLHTDHNATTQGLAAAGKAF